jgi:hypothetical protein
MQVELHVLRAGRFQRRRQFNVGRNAPRLAAASPQQNQCPHRDVERSVCLL